MKYLYIILLVLPFICKGQNNIEVNSRDNIYDKSLVKFIDYFAERIHDDANNKKIDSQIYIIKKDFLKTNDTVIDGFKIHFKDYADLANGSKVNEGYLVVEVSALKQKYNELVIVINCYGVTLTKKRRHKVNFEKFFVTGGIYALRYDCNKSKYVLVVLHEGEALYIPK